MKKIIFLLAALSLAALLLAATGCGIDPPPGPKSGHKGGNELQAEVPVEYERWTNEGAFSEEIPEKIQEAIGELKRKRGYFAFNRQEFLTGQHQFILISSGEKHTGGYSLELKSLTAANNALRITVEEIKPAQEKAVIQVLTYPLVLIKIKNSCDSFAIANTAGEEFLPLDLLAH